MTPLTIVINLDPNILRLGPLLITWHGVFAVLGIVAAARLGFWLLDREGAGLPNAGDLLFWMVALGIVGARLLFVWENYRIFENGQWLRAFAVTEGGISQWGGLFGAIIGALIWARLNRFSFWKIIDGGGAGAMIGLAIGRIGDVINGEHHGTPTTLPWGVDYVNPSTLGEPGSVVHPEVAYEMVLCLAILAVILPFHGRLKRRLPDGVVGLVYLGAYALGRFFLSYFRADMQIVFGLRQAQIASGLMVVIALVAIPLLIRRARAIAAPAPAIPDRDGSRREPLGESSEPSAPPRSTNAAKPASSRAADGSKRSS